MKTYTLGEIQRLGLLKSRSGTPYEHKGNISKIARGMKKTLVKTKHGLGYAIPLSEIEAHNKKWAK